MSLKDAIELPFTTGVTVAATRHARGQDWGTDLRTLQHRLAGAGAGAVAVCASPPEAIGLLCSGGYLVNVLEQSQQALAIQFSQGTQTERFAASERQRLPSGRCGCPNPWPGSVCRLWQVVPAGDHEHPHR